MQKFRVDIEDFELPAHFLKKMDLATVNPRILKECRSLTWEGVPSCDVVVFHTESTRRKSCSTREALNIAHELELQKPSFLHGLAFAKKYPNEQLSSPIVFLHEPVMDEAYVQVEIKGQTAPGILRAGLALTLGSFGSGPVGRPSLYMNNQSGSWPDFFRFAFITNSADLGVLESRLERYKAFN